MQSSFLQSQGWGAFQRSFGKTVRQDGCQMIREELGLGLYYWYCPRGVLTELPKDGVFVRIDPVSELSFPKMRKAPRDVQPSTSVVLDLEKSVDDLQKAMHHKTRYNIKVAERHGVKIEIGGVELFDAFWQMLEATTARDAFRAHAKSYYQKMFADHGDPNLKIFVALATIDGKPAAGAILCDFGGTRTYLHGASNYELRDMMAPYALHWQLIQDAKSKGFLTYDFFGIAPTDDPNERLAGVTRFKKGWGGEVVRYPRTQDLILQPWRYRLYRLAHRILTRS